MYNVVCAVTTAQHLYFITYQLPFSWNGGMYELPLFSIILEYFPLVPIMSNLTSYLALMSVFLTLQISLYAFIVWFTVGKNKKVKEKKQLNISSVTLMQLREQSALVNENAAPKSQMKMALRFSSFYLVILNEILTVPIILVSLMPFNCVEFMLT